MSVSNTPSTFAGVVHTVGHQPGMKIRVSIFETGTVSIKQDGPYGDSEVVMMAHEFEALKLVPSMARSIGSTFVYNIKGVSVQCKLIGVGKDPETGKIYNLVIDSNKIPHVVSHDDPF